MLSGFQSYPTRIIQKVRRKMQSGRVYMLALPTCSPQSTSARTLTLSKTNIFRVDSIERRRELEGEQQTQFDYVGLREIANFKEKMEKKKRVMVSDGRHSTRYPSLLTSIPTQLLGQSSRDAYLTKEQLVDRKQPLEEQVIRRGKKNKFSMTRLKNKMEEYRQAWNNTQHLPVHTLKRKIHHKTCNNSVSSIAQLNDTSVSWQHMLRRKKEKEGSRTHHGRVDSRGLKSVGRSKWEQEYKWIDNKDKQGYFFRAAQATN